MYYIFYIRFHPRKILSLAFQEKEPYDALAFMTDVFSKLDDSESLTPELVIRTFKSAYGRGFKEQNVDEVFEEDSEYDVGRQLAKDFVSRSGFKSLPQVRTEGTHLTVFSMARL